MTKAGFLFAALFAAGAMAQAYATADATNAAAATPVVAVNDSANAWGYGYDSLLHDLGEWRKSPYVRIDSIGASVQGRALWMLSISDSTDSLGGGGDRKRRVFIHARTHPAEVQAFYVVRETIKKLLDTGDVSKRIRKGFIFNIIPMYNPDGVMLGHSRLNAHLVDLESDWDKQVLEPEPMALQKAFQGYMAGPIPVEVALNLHSDQVNCTRFFVFHAAAGTSSAYEDLERKFIGGVQAYFPGGIKDWDFLVSWTDGTALRYPEGFWWSHFRENVMALTYEDTNCPNASGYDTTGRALALGASDYIGSRPIAGARMLARGVTRMLLGRDGVFIPASSSGAIWEVFDLRGRRLAAGALTPATSTAGASSPGASPPGASPAGTGSSEGTVLAWSSLPDSPVRILSLIRPGSAPERIALPPGLH